MNLVSPRTVGLLGREALNKIIACRAAERDEHHNQYLRLSKIIQDLGALRDNPCAPEIAPFNAKDLEVR